MEQNRCNLPSVGEHIVFEWRDLNAFVADHHDRKQILFNANGRMQSGELLAVMGGSGAGTFCVFLGVYVHRKKEKEHSVRGQYNLCPLQKGKSTLLDALSGRTNLSQQHIEGQLAINGNRFKVANQSLMKAVCTFVPQSDVLCPTQTVEEALRFYARMKLARLPRGKQEERVQYLMNVLHLDRCRHNLIGDEKKVRWMESRRYPAMSMIIVVAGNRGSEINDGDTFLSLDRSRTMDFDVADPMRTPNAPQNYGMSRKNGPRAKTSWGNPKILEIGK